MDDRFDYVCQLNFENMTNAEMCQENVSIMTDSILISSFKMEIRFPLAIPGTVTTG